MPFPSDPRSRSVLGEKLLLLLWPFVFYGAVFLKCRDASVITLEPTQPFCHSEVIAS
jgi:hypothetical protein